MGRPSTKTTETIKKEEVKVEKTKVAEPKVESKDLKKEPINAQAEEIAKLQAQIDLLMKAQVAIALSPLILRMKKASSIQVRILPLNSS